MFRREAKRCCFYFCFYIALLAFFSLMMVIFFKTIDVKRPKWILNESLIGSNPGLTIRPTKIWYNLSNPQSYKFLISQIDDFLSIYKLQDHNEHKIYCDSNHFPRQDNDQTCAIDLREYGSCNSENQYGYSKGRPCVFLKLNKIFGWEPQYYNATSLPKNIPEELKNLIIRYEQRWPERLKIVWVNCKGETPVDQENIGPIIFFPARGFPGYFFPYTNQYDYLSPLVAVNFEHPARHVLINVVCEAWAANLVHDHVEGRGVVRFSLLVD